MAYKKCFDSLLETFDNVYCLPHSGRNIAAVVVVVAVAADVTYFVVSKALEHLQNSLNCDLVQSWCSDL